jgi:predicted lipid carrier protein YhbT
VASIDECRAALDYLAEMLEKVDPVLRERHVLDRTVACTVKDLGVVFTAHLRDGGLHDIEQVVTAKAQLRATLSSDDLVRLTRGELDVAAALTRGKLRVDASVFDLLKLRSLVLLSVRSR